MTSPVAVLFTLVALAATLACEEPSSSYSPELVYADRPSTWVPPLPELRISPDEKWAAFGRGQWLRMVELDTGQSRESERLGELDSVTDIVFRAGAEIARRGSKGEDPGWYLGESKSNLPSDAVVRFSPDGVQVAFYRAAEPRALIAGPIASPESFELARTVRALEWARDGSGLFLLLQNESGETSLMRIALPRGTLETIVEHLDAPLRASAIGVAQDGQSIYAPLASGGALNLEARHDPDADRDLDIYEVDLATGEKNIVVRSPMDDLAPVPVGDALYWTRVEYRQSIVVMPASGGTAHVVAEGGQIPYWSPDSRQIAYTVGLPSAADAPLNMDADVVDLDGNARAVSEPRRVIAGYHEDFTPAWSPDGRWLAFHSHRAPGPVPLYHSDGATDDMYLLRNGAPMSDEIRLTYFGWEMGMADWSPDGNRLVFSSWDKDGRTGIGVAWIVTIDPQSGEALGLERIELPEIRSAKLVFWSPAGEAIAIENDAGGGQQSIWILDLETRDLEKVIEYDSDTYSGLDWTPDGRTIVYSAREPGEDDRFQLFAVARAGGSPSRLSDDDGHLMQPQVSPDGRWIAATRIEMTRQLWRRKVDKILGP